MISSSLSLNNYKMFPLFRVCKDLYIDKWKKLKLEKQTRQCVKLLWFTSENRKWKWKIFSLINKPLVFFSTWRIEWGFKREVGDLDSSFRKAYSLPYTLSKTLQFQHFPYFLQPINNNLFAKRGSPIKIRT